jgi:hypothetical protein
MDLRADDRWRAVNTGFPNVAASVAHASRLVDMQEPAASITRFQTRCENYGCYMHQMTGPETVGDVNGQRLIGRFFEYQTENVISLHWRRTTVRSTLWFICVLSLET